VVVVVVVVVVMVVVSRRAWREIENMIAVMGLRIPMSNYMPFECNADSVLLMHAPISLVNNSLVRLR
jgi:hypothetical protein